MYSLDAYVVFCYNQSMTTYKFKLYKDDDFNHLHDIINVAGIIYNHCIALHKRYYKDHAKHLDKFRLQKHITTWKRRRFVFWKQAQELCKKFDVIACEDLNLQGMQQLWGRKVSDLGFAEFLRILEAQAKKYRTKVVYVDRFFPSSKRCSVCGKVNQELQLSTRTWRCVHCGTEHDRDVNASRNILYEGLRQIA